MAKYFGYYAIILTIICIAVYIVTSFFPFLINEYKFVPSLFFAKPWTIITHIFLHGSFTHLFYNMFALALFGTILEKNIGSKKLLFLFFAAGIVSSTGDFFFYPHGTIGASGAIYGLLGCLAVLKPKMVVWALGVPMYMAMAAGLWILIDLTGFFYPDNVAHMAHLLGMGFGLIVGLELRRKMPKKTKKEKPREPEKPSDEELDAWEQEWMVNQRQLLI